MAANYDELGTFIGERIHPDFDAYDAALRESKEKDEKIDKKAGDDAFAGLGSF